MKLLERTSKLLLKTLRIGLLACLLSVSLLAIDCIGHYFLAHASSGKPDPEKVREQVVAASPKIVLHTVWPTAFNDHFVEGAMLAVEEINEQGGLLGKTLELRSSDETTDYLAAMNTAINIANTPDVYAVIGQSAASNSAIAASVVYESNGVMLISPGASNRQLVSHDFKGIFQTIADDHEVGTALVEVCAALDYKNIAVVYQMPAGVRGISYGESLSNAIIDRAAHHDIKVSVRRSFFTGETNFITTINQIKAANVDAIILATLPDGAVSFMLQAKQLELKIPLLGGDRLESADLIIDSRGAAEGLLIVSQGDPAYHSQMGKEFKDAFEKRWGLIPSVWSAKAYDAVQLLAYSITRSQSIEREVVASFLRSIKNWEGVSGIHSFHSRGDVYGIRLYLREVIHGSFRQHHLDKHLKERLVEEMLKDDPERSVLVPDGEAPPAPTVED